MAQESDLEKNICRLCEMAGCYVRKFTSNHTGVPDRIITKELTLFLEFKAPGERPSLLQQDEIATICRAGGFATWVDSHEDAVEVTRGVISNRADWLREACQERNYWMKK